MDSPHAVLGVDPDADEETIDRAYRERVKETHPDQGGSPADFIAVRTAYERLQGDWQATDDGGPDPAWEPGHANRDRGHDSTAGPAADTHPDGDARPAEVTYLNHDVVTDYGWDVTDDDLFARAAEADLSDVDHGRFVVSPDESLLEAAEARGFAWPFACRGGACANCAVYLHEGDLSQPVDHVLPPDLIAAGFRLSCNGIPLTDDLDVVYNVKHMPELETLLLPPGPFRRAHGDD